MSRTKLRAGLMELDRAIGACAEARTEMGALILLYSAMDVSAWLASDAQQATRATFIAWVERYLLPAKDLECSAIDLYGARCGLLHTLTPESALSRQGTARQIGYAWGNASAEALRASRHAIGADGDYAAVHFNDLHEAWRLGTLAFLSELEADPNREAQVLAKASMFFARPPRQLIESFVDAPT